MSILRGPVRRSKAFGAQLPAIVEEVHFGHATIRLAPNGARITNLPTMGTIHAGDQVVLDYAAGEPYVRQATIPATQEETGQLSTSQIFDSDFEIPTGNPAITAVKLEGGSQNSYTISGGSNYWKPVSFTKKIFDPDTLSNGQDITFKTSGMYFWYANIAAEVEPYVDEEINDNVNFPYFAAMAAVKLPSGNVYELGGWRYILAYDGNAVIACIKGLYPFKTGETLSIYTYSWAYGVMKKLIHEDNLYPVVAAWKVNPLKNITRTSATS